MKFFVKDFCKTVQARVVLSYLLIRPCFLSDFRFFFTLNNDIFIKDFCEIVQAGVIEFCMQDYNDVLYCGISNQPSHAYSSLHLSNCFLSILWIKEVFVKDFFETVQARVVIFDMQVDNEVLYRRSVNQPLHFFPVFVRFYFFPYFE